MASNKKEKTSRKMSKRKSFIIVLQIRYFENSKNITGKMFL